MDSTIAPPANTDEYLARVPDPARGLLDNLRAIIRAAAPPEATEAISYRIPIFRYKGALVGFAAFRKHCSLFVMSATVLTPFTDEIRIYKTSKGTIQFPFDKPLPVTLIRRIVKARVKENETNKR